MGSTDGTKRGRLIPPERLDYVEGLYLSGTPDQRIVRMVAKRYEVTRRTARNYLVLVRERFPKRPAPPPEAIIARSDSLLLDAYLTAKRRKHLTQWGMQDAPDCATMAAAAWRLAELHGAASTRVRIDMQVGQELDQALDKIKAGLTPTEYERVLAALAGEQGSRAAEGDPEGESGDGDAGK